MLALRGVAFIQNEPLSKDLGVKSLAWFSSLKVRKTVRVIKFGDLLLLEKIASGGMAEVFRAKQLGHQGFEKNVAIKRILPHFAQNKKFKKMFQQEARLTATLEHPNIAHVYANGECEGYLYLVMELVDGKNLRSILSQAEKVKRSIPMEMSCFIVCEILRGLDYAHNKIDENTGKELNIVHRDVSPHNIIVSYKGNVKLVDFGIAKAASNSEITQTGTIKGKFAYLSPEQVRGEAVDRKCDVFSAGIILWELLAQQRLFGAENSFTILDNVKECEVPSLRKINPQVPEALEKIVSRALQKNPTERFSTALDFYTELVRFMNSHWPHFIPTDISVFMQKLFQDEIIQLRKVREQAEEALPEAALREDLDVTQLSQSNETSESHDPKVGLYKKIVETRASSSSIRVMNTETSYRQRRAAIKAEQAIIPMSPVKRSVSLGGVIRMLLFIILFSGLCATLYFSRTYIQNLNVSETLAYLKSFIPESKPSALKERKPAAYIVNEPVVESKEKLDDNSLFIWNPHNKEVYGSIEIKSFPDAEVYIEGKKLVDKERMPVRTPIKGLQLNPGKYEIELRNSYFGISKSMTVTIEVNKTHKFEVFFNKK